VGNTASSLGARLRNSVSAIHNHNHQSSMFQKIFKTIKLVVVMSAVNLWKAQKPQTQMSFTKLRCQWLFVSIVENTPELPGWSSI
jgi:hypothetical protein